ncbi:uncharacterized protein BXIN_2046 [Babesia sp. Xinjiang]|uniref:uncharacterized protein n=1 Tax=Babesia sp. Xinjiang TaxID=462227 RepID=UPI000A231205|nr:uncharacterized protein BXIN_2046 [Babesia sp. Xinjiang]ORM40543.1 hypothetical protein BXIN_2046 [Babesia sp. Xinjiang]
MGKFRSSKLSVDKKAHSSDGIANPFDAIRRSDAKISVRRKTPRRTKVVRKSVGEASFSNTLPRRSQKLELYDLNKPLTLTHKDAPIEEHYEDSVSDNSEDDFRYNGDLGGLAQALEEHKNRRALERQEKTAQRDLLSKLDSEFEHIDVQQFIRPRRGSPNFSSEHGSPVTPNVPDKYSENLHRLMVAPHQSRDGGDLLRRMFAASDIKTRCEIAKQFVRHGHISSDTANRCILEVARPLSELLGTPNGHQQFGSYIEPMTEFVHYLCQRSPKEYHAYFSNFLKGVYVSFETDDVLSLEAVIVLYLLIKVTKVGTALYRGSLIVLEHLMCACDPKKDDHARVRLLIATAYASTLDSGLYMPFFFKLAMRLLNAWREERPQIVDTVLDMVIASLKLLSSRGCHVYPICLHIISPNIANLSFESPKLDRLKALVEEYSSVELLPNVLDVYKRPKVELQVPNFESVSSRRFAKDSAVKREKALYRSLKREFIHTAAAEANLRSLELRQRRERSRERYRKVLRDAMVEQEELRKESTKPT